jgi:hypothetical protein
MMNQWMVNELSMKVSNAYLYPTLANQRHYRCRRRRRRCDVTNYERRKNEDDTHPPLPTRAESSG